MKLLLILFIFISSFSIFGMHEVIPDCYLYYTPKYKNKIEFTRDSELSVLSYNTLNLQRTTGRYLTKNGVRVFEQAPKNKPLWQTRWIARIIKDKNPDVLVLQEVEGRQAVYQFNRKHLNNDYEIFYVGGNDQRGINIAILMHKRMPFKYEIHSHRKLKMKDPTPGKEGEEIGYFSRDFPVLIVKDEKENPLFLVGGVHLKSQRARGDDPNSTALRTAQVENTLEVLEDYQKVYPDIPMFVAGDFNADLITKPEFASLRSKEFLTDAFDGMPREERITHSFHPRGGETQYSQLDGIFFRNARKVRARVLPYKDPKTRRVKPLPKTWDERNTNPSDHFPIFAKFKLNN